MCVSVDNVYACADWLHAALMSFRFLFRSTLDAIFVWFLNMKIQKISRDFRVEKMIHEVRGSSAHVSKNISFLVRCNCMYNVNRVEKKVMTSCITVCLLADILFFDTDGPRTDEQKQARKDKALHCLIDIFPSKTTKSSLLGHFFLLDNYSRTVLSLSI